MNKVAVIQARMGSTRLAGKVLKILKGETVIEHIYNRVSAATSIDKVVVATTTSSIDNVLVDYCKSKNMACFRGDEDNVLKRFYECAKQYEADIVIRVTADDPFKDPKIIERAVSILLKNDYDYVSNTINPTYPEGIDIEVFKITTLEKAYLNASLPSEKEHVTPYIWKNSDMFNNYNFENDTNLSTMRWTLDTSEDFEFIEAIYEHLYEEGKIFYMEDILNILKMYPHLSEINAGRIRNEGYLKSLSEEKGDKE